MGLKINKESFEAFLEITRIISKHYNILPILYGSLGLNLAIGEFVKANDVDILIHEKYIKEKWNDLINLMKTLKFKLKNKCEHEFERGGIIVAFAKESDIQELAKISPRKLQTLTTNKATFKTLTPKQYLKVYKSMNRDNYRIEKRGKEDIEKIIRIRNFLSKNH